MVKTKSLIKDSFVYGGTSILVKMASYFLTMILTYQLGRESFGIMTNLYAYVALIIVILTFGMETGFFRFANQSKNYQPTTVYSTSLIIVGSIVLFFLVIFLGFLPSVRTFIWQDNIPNLYVGMVIVFMSMDAFSAIPFAYLRYKKKAKKFGLLKLLNVFLYVFLTLFFLIACPWINKHAPTLISWFYIEDFRLGYVLFANLLATSIQTAFLLPELTGFKYKFDSALAKKMLIYSFPLVIMGIAGMSNQVVDKIVFPAIFPDSETAYQELGIYSGCFKIAVIMIMFTQAFRYAYEPFVFEKSKEKDAKQAYADVMKYFIIFGLLVFLGVMFYLDIFKYFVSPDFFGGLGIVPIALLGELFFAIYFNLSFWYKLTDKTYWGTIFSVIGCITIVFINIIFIPTYSYWACAWAAFIGNGLIMLLSYFVGQKNYPIQYDLKTIGIYTGLTAILYAISCIVPLHETWIRIGFNTLLLLVYLLVFYKRDFPYSFAKPRNRNGYLVNVLLLLCLVFTSCGSKKNSLESSQWKITFDSEKKTVNIAKKSALVANGLYASYIWNEKKITSKEYVSREFSKVDTHDSFGKGTVFTIRYKKENLPDLIQSFYVYPDKDYLLTDFSLENKGETIASNYMSPVTIDEIRYLPETENNRALFIPYDNDCWIRYQSHPLNFNTLRSYEVSAVFDNTSRKGIVVGSVEHDNWKTAVELTSSRPNHLGSLVCYGGVADTLTRDSKPHGALSGKTIKSPKALLGFFDDWRNGLDTYGDVNAAVAPPKTWNKAVPFGWNSWGVLQFNLNYPKAIEVSDFFKDNLQSNHFVNPDKTIYVGLDSGWNSFTEEELTAFVKKCKENRQVAGVYWTPFTDWGKKPERTVQDAEQYTYKDIYLYANGKPQQLDGAYAIDPTHPAIEERMKKTSELFHRCGFEYVKTDFMTHGAMEADHWYLPEITTGTQAYNYGMKLLNKYFGDMYINLSISPIFPAQYAQSRRIACDAWNKIKDTEYTMNALSYGWWIDRVYQYNDADHVVLRGATEGENRARVTSAAITGLFIAGDDFSKEGTKEGKEKAIQYLTNPRINEMATGVSFRPLEGNGEKSENQFMRTDEQGTYYVYFNYGEESVKLTIPLERIGLKAAGNYTATELWRNEKIDLRKVIEVPGKDVFIVLIK